ncbi:submaxillary gland androgen-regulated protein 3A-like [Trachypithecus francoisi]|uniref:submaxillary gland androgen-regulated protein 3A-like n=1 Tax=Trachypithecus francoisi TaxID=54180 RepID=UPI00141BCA50|nr:submaxillary gland androgen-regulated protein 3A-like [Trachypithecus francoisi]
MPLSRQPRPAAPRESLRAGAGFGPAAPPSHPEAPGDSRGRAEARGAGAGRGPRGAYRPEAYRRPPHPAAHPHLARAGRTARPTPAPAGPLPARRRRPRAPRRP